MIASKNKRHFHKLQYLKIELPEIHLNDEIRARLKQGIDENGKN